MTSLFTEPLALCLSALLGLAHAHAHAARAEAAYPQLVRGGENVEINHGPGPHGNIVGGGVFHTLRN